VFESSDDLNVFDDTPSLDPVEPSPRSQRALLQQQGDDSSYSYAYEAAGDDGTGVLNAGDAAETNVFELDRAGTEAALAALPEVETSEGDKGVPASDGQQSAPSSSSLASTLLDPLKSLLPHGQRLLAHLNPERWAEMAWATASSNQRLNQFMYNHSLKLSVGTQFMCILVRPTSGSSNHFGRGNTVEGC
jgi:hypothetical protein